LTVRGSAVPVSPQKLDVTELNSAIQKVNPDSLITAAGRRAVIEDLPCYKRAQQLAEEAETRERNADITIMTLLAESAADAEALRPLDEERKALDIKLKSLNSQGPARMALALQQKIQELKDECNRLNVEISRLDNVQGDEYGRRFFELKQKQNFASLLSDHFSQRILDLRNR
jgi:hypothetical protein